MIKKLDRYTEVLNWWSVFKLITSQPPQDINSFNTVAVNFKQLTR